uniref:Saliva protein-9 n=1 Tax=Tetranychus truncatus TaxID=93132 RepID=A0A3G5APH0_9ACAR|nr:saliva protein-9 [Tetranychus truncatus]
MRFTIILALCFIGAVSASSLNKRSFIDDIQNNTQNAFHAFEQFGQTFNQKVQEALKNLLSAFGNKTQSTEASVSVSKRATNPLVLFNDLSDPAKFAQDFMKVLADMAMGQGRRKRDVAEDLKKFAESAKQNAEQGLAKLFEFLEQFKAQFAHDQTDAEKVVSKRDIQETIEKFNELAQTKAQEAFQNIRQALDNLFKGNPFFQSISSHFNNGEDSTEKSVSKRDVFDNFEKFSQNAFENFKQSFERFFNQFSNHGTEAESSTESD